MPFEEMCLGRILKEKRERNLNHGKHFFLKEKILLRNIATIFTFLYKKTSEDLLVLY